MLLRLVEPGQYVSRAFADLCTELGVTRSMGAIGTSADNAACESFHASLKRETLQDTHDFGDAHTCRRTVFAWLTRYNTRRRHSANGHLSPNEYHGFRASAGLRRTHGMSHNTGTAFRLRIPRRRRNGLNDG